MSHAGARRSPVSFPVQVPFVEHLGLQLHAMAEGRSDLRLDLEDKLTNSFAVAHGGVVMTMMDVAMAMAARSLRPDGQGVATVEMKCNFLHPAEQHLRAHGRVVHQTATLAFCDAELRDDRGQLCATAQGTFKYLRSLPRRRLEPAADAQPPLG